MAGKHLDHCPAERTDWEEHCICPTCELCGEPSQGKFDVNGLDICDECWPHLVADSDELT